MLKRKYFLKITENVINCPLTVVSPLPWTNSLILPGNNVHSEYKPSTTITNHTLFFQNIAFLKYQIATVKPRVPKIRLASSSPIHIRSCAAVAILHPHAQVARRVQAAPALEATQLAWGQDSESVDWRAEPPGAALVVSK